MPGASSPPHQRGRSWRGDHRSSLPLPSLHLAIIPPVHLGRSGSLMTLGGPKASLHTSQDSRKKSKHPQKEADSCKMSPSRLSWKLSETPARISPLAARLFISNANLDQWQGARKVTSLHTQAQRNALHIQRLFAYHISRGSHSSLGSEQGSGRIPDTASDQSTYAKIEPAAADPAGSKPPC